MKKVLVLTLALVMAIAGSAMAAVDFGGEFEAKINQSVLTWDKDEGAFRNGEPGSFGFLNGDFGFSHYIKLKAKSSSDTWSLDLNFDKDTDVIKNAFAKLDGNAGYTLKVNDDLFNLMVWQGSTNHQGYVNDPFSLIRARRSNSATTIRAKANIMDLANLTLQLEPESSVVAHLTGDVAGVELGLIAQRKFNDTKLYDTSTPATFTYIPGENVMVKKDADNDGYFATIENALDTVALHAAYDFEVAKVTVGGGISMNNTTAKYETLTPEQKAVVDTYLGDLENRFAYAVKVEVPVTEEISAEASYVVKQQNWKGNGSNSAVATLKANYETEALEVAGSFTTSGKHVNADNKDDRTTTFALDGTYNFTEDMNVSLGAEYKVEKDKLSLTDNINTTKLTANVSAPVVEDLVSVDANLGYTSDNTGAILVGTYLANPEGLGKSGATLRYHSTVALAKSLFEAGASVKVTPMDKLTVTPAVDFKSFKDGNVDQAAVIRQLRDADYYKQYIDAYHFTAGSILTLKADASYKVGGNATLTLSAGNHAYNFTAISGDSNDTLKYNNPFASLAVKVTF